MSAYKYLENEGYFDNPHFNMDVTARLMESYKDHCINSINDEMIAKEARETFKNAFQQIAFVRCWLYVKQKLLGL